MMVSGAESAAELGFELKTAEEYNPRNGNRTSSL